MKADLILVSDFRLFAEDTNDGVVYSVHEVFYMNHHPVDYVQVPLTLISQDTEDLIAEIQLVLEAFSMPVLSFDRFPEEY